MRKLQPLILVLLFTLCLGFGRKPVLPTEGVYTVKDRVFTYFDLFSQDLSMLMINPAELTESPPPEINVAEELKKLEQIRYGSVRFGNTDQKTWFVVGSEKGVWPVAYIDQNNDRIIETNEKIKEIQTNQGREKGMQAQYGRNFMPFSVRVVFKGTSDWIEKKQYFFALFEKYTKDGNSEELVRFISASFLDGEMKVYDGRKYQMVNYRIVDGNSNGCFNDYGTDFLFFDADFDGYFKMKEARPLPEFFDFIGPDKQKKQMRLVVMPHPAKIAVVEATQEIDRSTLEPASEKK